MESRRATPSPGVLRVEVHLSSPIAQAGVEALLQGLNFEVVPPGPAPEALTTVLVVDDLWLAGSRTGDTEDGSRPLVVLGEQPDWWEALSEHRSGGWAWLSPGATAAELQVAVLGAASGLVVLSPERAGDLSLGVSAQPPVMLSEPLTPREREVLDLLTLGLSNKRAAQRLGITENTVKFHVQSLFGKLGVNSRTSAATRAVQLGLTFV